MSSVLAVVCFGEEVNQKEDVEHCAAYVQQRQRQSHDQCVRRRIDDRSHYHQEPVHYKDGDNDKVAHDVL